MFSTISSVLTLPRDPGRPLIALVVTDGEANAGVSDTGAILSKFTALNDGLVSVYMYGVKTSLPAGTAARASSSKDGSAAAPAAGSRASPSVSATRC